MADSIIRKFKSKIHKTDSCWEWTGAPNSEGYGQLEFYVNKKKRSFRAHRYSYEYFVGAIPKGLCVLHKCDNRICVNPDHLFLGTRADNNKDRDAKGRHKPFIGIEHPRCKLTEEQVRFAFYSKGELTSNEAGKLIGISGATVRDIRCGRSWKHLGLKYE